MLSQSALNAKTLVYLRSERYQHIIEHFFFVCSRTQDLKLPHAFFISFFSLPLLFCASQIVPLHTWFSPLLMQPCFLSAEKYHLWRPHLYSLSYTERSRTQRQQSGVSLLPICRSSLGEEQLIFINWLLGLKQTNIIQLSFLLAPLPAA